MKNTISNEIIAQQNCFSAIQRASVKLERILKEFIKKGYIKDYNLFIEGWNNGYCLKTNLKYDFNNYVNLPIKVQKFICNVYMIYIQPDTFFHLDLVEGKSRLKYGTFNSEGETIYDSYKVTNIMEVDSACDDFVETIKL